MRVQVLDEATGDLADGYHRLLSKRFPFAVYYRIDDRVARVRAVLDCRRDPEWIEDRLG